MEQVLDVRPFRLAEGTWTYHYRAGAPRIRSGHVVVLRGRPELVQPRAVRSAVLYAGPVPVHVVAWDVPSGCVAGVLPPEVVPDEAPFFFGSWELPERVDAARGAAELQAALELGIVPRPEAERAGWSRRDLTAPTPEALADEVREALSACTHTSTHRDVPETE